MATAMGRADTIVAQLAGDNERLRVLLWALVQNSPVNAVPTHVLLSAVHAILAPLLAASTADLQLDQFARWRADLLAVALSNDLLASTTESVATALIDDIVAARRSPLDAVLLLRLVPPLVRGAVPRLRALLLDRASLVQLVTLDAQSPTPTTIELLIDLIGASGDMLVPLANELVTCCAASINDDELRPLALRLVSGVCLRLAGIDFVSPTRNAFVAALKPALLPFLAQQSPSVLLDALVAIVAGSKDQAAALELSLAAAHSDAQLFATLLSQWHRAFPELVSAVIAAGVAATDDPQQLSLLARICSAPQSLLGRAVRQCVRLHSKLLVEQLSHADSHEPHALACFALLRATFATVDGAPECCNAFGDAVAHNEERRVRVLRDALCQLRLALHLPHAVELIKLFVSEVVLHDTEPNSVTLVAAIDSLVSLVAPLVDEREPTPTVGAVRPTSSLLLAACERHKRARLHSGAASANSSATLFSGKEFVRPAARAPRPNAHSAPHAFEAGDVHGQHAFDLLSRVCAADERRLATVRRALVFRANVAAGIMPMTNNQSHAGNPANGGSSGFGNAPPTPAHEGASSAPPTPSQRRDELAASHEKEPAAAPVESPSTSSTLSCSWTTAGVPGGDAVGHTTVRRLCDWLNAAPRLLDVVRLVARDAAAFQRERVLVMLIQSGLAVHGRRLAAGARSEFELRRLAAVCRELGWTSTSLAALAEQCSQQDVRAVIAALRETLGDTAAASAQANMLSVSALEHGSWEAVFRSRSIDWK